MGRVIVVQPDASRRREVARALVAGGHSVVPVATAREAESLGESFEVGVVDLELPDGSGMHLAARLSGFGRLHARVFTASDLECSAARRAAPMGAVVAHDAPLTVLLEAVARALGSREHGAQPTRSGVRSSAPAHAWPFPPREADSKGG